MSAGRISTAISRPSIHTSSHTRFALLHNAIVPVMLANGPVSIRTSVPESRRHSSLSLTVEQLFSSAMNVSAMMTGSRYSESAAVRVRSLLTPNVELIGVPLWIDHLSCREQGCSEAHESGAGPFPLRVDLCRFPVLYKNQIERRKAAQLKKRAGVVPATRLTTPIWHSYHST